MRHSPETTVTLQTPPGQGGIAVILLSGGGAEKIIGRVFRPLRADASPGTGVLRLGHLTDGKDVIDEAIVTQRDGAFEINIHGGPVVARKTLELLARCGATVTAASGSPEGFPTAHPRWHNPAIGREMLRLLPQARSALVVEAVSRQWSAGLSELVSDNPAAEELRRAAAGLEKMRRLLKPAEVVLAGEANVGKSTLANALVGRQVSIVHDQPGTTRDWVREIAVISGVPVWLTDTAGLWNAPTGVDAEAVRRARKCINSADLVVLLAVGEVPRAPGWLAADRTLPVVGKCDIVSPRARNVVAISARTGEGMDRLKAEILRQMGMASFRPAAAMAFTERQANLLNLAADALDSSDPPGAGRAIAKLLAG